MFLITKIHMLLIDKVKFAFNDHRLSIKNAFLGDRKHSFYINGCGGRPLPGLDLKDIYGTS